ncbi:MAG: bifunctional pyr operon transcriptional regulator/uracil phosphoribosyltransferase PyrR [Candidatus Wallbacteria bacterium]|nr:bifunctional pyr operon transcriptional regulator/uracil phosphoribosyltransferase PyrR [Candidatus Wallbacteria bacterium]
MKKKIADQAQVSKLISECVEGLSRYLVDGKTVFIGIQTRGAVLAKRMIRELAAQGRDFPLGILDITLYRDDFTQVGKSPVVRETRIDFDIEDQVVILVDDVLYTGRTIRAALDEITDFGRPRQVKLAVLIDRGGRELPIQADVCGQQVKTSDGEVKVMMKETDGEDAVFLIRGEDK